MNILILGPQGSGKGTQGKLIAQKFGFTYLSSGDMIRAMAKTHHNIEEMMDKGQLIPDEVSLELTTDYLETNKHFDNIVLDGTPRTTAQYHKMKEWFHTKGTSIDLGLVLTISREESIKRLSGRRMDPTTGAIYNLVTSPKPPAGVDVLHLLHRDDDKPEAINRRLDIYESSTLPLIEEMRKDGILVEVNGERTIEEIQTELVEIVKERQLNPKSQ